MNINKKTIVLFLVFSIMFSITGCNQTKDANISKLNASPTIAESVHQDYPGYSEIGDLCNASDLVIIGEVSKFYEPEVYEIVTTAKGEKIGVIFTVSDINVEQVFKGDCKPGDIIQVKQMGGRYNNKDYYNEELEMFDTNMRGFFFLKTFLDYPAEAINPYQGFVKIVDSKVYPYVIKHDEGTYTEDLDSPGLIPAVEEPLFLEGQAQKDIEELIMQNI